MQGGYNQEPPLSYATMYTTGPYQNSMYTMAPPSSMAAYSDPRYPQDYQYPPGARGDMPPGAYGYAPNGSYPDPGRSRPDMQAGYYAATGQNVPRMMEDPRDPRFTGYDSMTGMQQTGNAYGGVPPRGQMPSPYDPVPREHYNRPPPAADAYGSRRR